MATRPTAPETDLDPAATYSDLKALFLSCTLKKSPQASHTEDLMANAMTIMAKAGVAAELVRVVDHHVAFGVSADMTEHGWDRDDWPALHAKVMAADILVVGTPIWLGEESSVCRMVIERLYAHSGETNEAGQYLFYGKVGGAMVTGNEDGIKHCAMTIQYALNHIGYTIAPQADSGWIGEAGPGASYGDDGTGYDNDFTKRNTTFMSWNLIHMARMLKDAGGVPAYGNQTTAWQDGERFGHPERS